MATKVKRNYWKEFSKGILKQNPLLVLVLGTCPALAVTTSLKNGLGMGLAATFVLIFTNLIISLLRKVIPDKVRIPAYITVIASMVTVLQFLLEAYAPDLNSSLGIFIPLITVNCIILGRAEAFANKNGPLISMLDGLGMGVGFTLALGLIGGIREILGNGTIYGVALPFVGPDKLFQPIALFIMPPGGFLIFGLVIACALALTRKYYAENPEAALEISPCAAGCAGCTSSCSISEDQAIAGATVKASTAVESEAKAKAQAAEKGGEQS